MDQTYDLSIITMSNFTEDRDVGEQNSLITYQVAIATIVVCCLGLVGNLLSLVVLTRKSLNSTTYIYLTGLAICDLLVLVFTIIIVAEDTKMSDLKPWQTGPLYAHLFPWMHPFATTFQVTSVWLTLAFTVDRFIMICFPFQAQRLCTKLRARITIGVLYASGLLFNIPKFFEYETHAIHIKNITHFAPQLTAFGKSPTFRQIFHSWLYFTFVCGVPFIALAVFNGFLIYAVHKSRKKGRQINANDRKRNDTTIMLIGVVVIFFICQVPALVSRVIWAFDPSLVFTNPSIHNLGEATNFLITLNSAINFVPYYLFGQRFRTECRKVLCRCCSMDALGWPSEMSDHRRASEMSYTSKVTRLNCNSLDLQPSGGSVISLMYGQTNGRQNDETVPFTKPEVNHNNDKFNAEIQL